VVCPLQTAIMASVATAKLFGKKDPYEDVDVEKLLEQLTAEELEQLGEELIDPDDPDIPPSERCRYKTEKAPEGPYNRQHLLDFLEKSALEEKDWEEARPYVKETRGKVYQAKVTQKVASPEDDIQTEWDEALINATEEELVDLAAILGFTGILNQEQYHEAFVENRPGDSIGGFTGVAKASPLKPVPDEPPNDTNVDTVLEQIQNNDPSLKEINLNNLKNISIERLVLFGEALRTNTNLETFCLANTRASDKVARAFAESIRENNTLKSLNLESNFISGEAICELLEAINVNQKITEFRIANQRPQTLGVKAEQRIQSLLQDNTTMVNLGVFLDTANARVKVQEYLQRNKDLHRQERVGNQRGK